MHFILGLLLEIWQSVRTKTNLRKCFIAYISDFDMIFKEIFEDKIYGLDKRYLPKPGAIIIDCGAHIGLYTIWASKYMTKVGRIIAVEPVYHNYLLLLLNIRLHRLGNMVVPLRVAISSKCYKCNILVGEWYCSSSLLKSHLISSKDVPRYSETALALTLDKLVKLLQLKQIDLIKIDVEGLEKEILKSSEKALAIAKRIIIEVHTTVNRPEEVVDLLRNRGFIIDHVFRRSEINTKLIYASNPSI